MEMQIFVEKAITCINLEMAAFAASKVKGEVVLFSGLTDWNFGLDFWHKLSCSYSQILLFFAVLLKNSAASLKGNGCQEGLCAETLR